MDSEDTYLFVLPLVFKVVKKKQKNIKCLRINHIL